ncbi:reverse transcriptase domain-containing protein [Tanacetum coccineum]
MPPISIGNAKLALDYGFIQSTPDTNMYTLALQILVSEHHFVKLYEVPHGLLVPATIEEVIAMRMLFYGPLCQLRGGQLNDLIYAFDDHDKEQSSRRAYVKLVYRLTDGMDVLFTRCITSTGGCEYRINDRVVNWEEYSARLKSHGILVKARNFLVFQGSLNKFTWYKNKALHTRIAAYSDQTRHDLTFVSTSWRHPWDLTLGITLRKMSAMANTTLIVTTVTKPTTKEKTPKEADATPRVNIQDFYEEHYEDILPVIMDKIRHDKRKEVHARLDYEESPKKRRIREGSQNSSARTLSARYRNPSERLKVWDRLRYNEPHVLDRLGIVPTVEAALAGGTLLTKIVLGAETTPVASKSHMIIPAPPMRQRPNLDIPHAIETTPVMRKIGGKVNPRHPAYQRVAPAMGDTGSQGDPEDHVKNFQAAAQVERWAMPTWFHMLNSTLIGAARVWFDELPPKSIDGYKDLKAAFLAYFMQQKKYVKDPVEIHNIKQRDEEIIEEFMERFKVETRRMKGAPECMRISRFMHGVNKPELTKRLNEHVPKTMEEMMITTIAFIQGETAAGGKKKGHASMTRQKVTQSFERVSEITFLSLTTSSEPEGPLIIEAKIGGHMIHRMYVDGGSLMELLYEHYFNQLLPEIKNQMVPAMISLTGFSGETIWPLGQLRLLVTIGDADHSTRAWMNFMIVRSLSTCNGIIGRPRIR